MKATDSDFLQIKNSLLSLFRSVAFMSLLADEENVEELSFHNKINH